MINRSQVRPEVIHNWLTLVYFKISNFPQGVEEFQDDSDLEDTFKYKKPESSQPAAEEAEKKKKSPIKKIDLGAAANFGAFTEAPKKEETAAPAAPSVSDFADFETSELSEVRLPASVSQPDLLSLDNGTSSASDDLFGDFSTATTTSAPPAASANPTENFANFDTLESLDKPVSNVSLLGDFDGLSLNTGPAPASTGLNMMSSQPPMMQPMAGSTMMGGGMMSNTSGMNMMQPMQQPGGGMMFPQQSNNLMIGASNNAASMQRFPNNSTANKTTSGSTMWSGTGVDISLDSLVPGGANQKRAMPSMNQMSGGQQFPQQQQQQQQGFFMQQQQQQGMQGNMMMGGMARPQMGGMMQSNMGGGMQMGGMGAGQQTMMGQSMGMGGMGVRMNTPMR